MLPADQERRADFWRSLLDSLALIPTEQLSAADRINYDIFKFILEDRVAAVDFEAYLIPFNAEGGFYNSLSFLPRRYAFSSGHDYDRYQERLRAFPQYMRDNLTLLSLGIEKGIVAPRLIAANYEVLIEPFLEPDIEKHLLYAPYRRFPDAMDTLTRDSLRAEGIRLIRDSIIPIYHALDEFMVQDYLPVAREGIGISEIPRGREYYEQRIAYFTTLPMSPEDVFQTGQREVARIRK